MSHVLHPEAALEHEEQVAYYEARSSGLGRRYHAAFRASLLRACEAPQRCKVIQTARYSPGVDARLPVQHHFSRDGWHHPGACGCSTPKAAGLLV